MGSLGSNTDTKTRGKDEGCECLPDSAAVRVCSQVSRPRPIGDSHLALSLLPPLQDRPGRSPAPAELLLPLVPRYQPLSGAFIPFQPHFVSGPHNAVVVSDVAAPAPAQVVDDIEAVDVATETDDGASALGEITVRDHIEALPAIPSSPFRDQSPVIPAGIVQATQPKFVQTIFKNPKISPILAQRFVINSKVSPVLQEFKANGVELV